MKIINRIDPSYVSLSENYDSDVVALIDCSILMDDQYENSVAVLMEPNHILSYFLGNNVDVFGEITRRLENKTHNFKKLYTTFKQFKNYPNVVIFEHTPLPSWISAEEGGIHQKTKDLVFITSDKGWTPQQWQRVHLADWLIKNHMPVYGMGYVPVERKIDVMSDSRFCVCIENESLLGYHTEKVVDCFKTGTIPLYVGDNDITKIYDSNGIFMFETVDDLRSSDIFKTLLEGKGREIYESKLNSVVANYNKYLSIEQYRTGEYVFGMINDDWKKYE